MCFFVALSNNTRSGITANQLAPWWCLKDFIFKIHCDYKKNHAISLPQFRLSNWQVCFKSNVLTFYEPSSAETKDPVFNWVQLSRSGYLFWYFGYLLVESLLVRWQKFRFKWNRSSIRIRTESTSKLRSGTTYPSKEKRTEKIFETVGVLFVTRKGCDFFTFHFQKWLSTLTARF